MTGQTLDDKYFRRLHELRNDDAQESKRNGKAKKKEDPQAQKGAESSGQGCESVHNDQTEGDQDAQMGCEAI